MSLLPDRVPGEAFAKASRFREDLSDGLTARGDELFDLADALLCADGPVTAPVDLTPVAEHRRGHGAMYDALNSGNVDAPRVRQVLVGVPMPQAADGRLVLVVDVSNWLRPDAPTSADRLFCHAYGRSGRSSDQFVPGWPYSFVAALESGWTSWCQLLDAVRLGPDDDVAEVIASQVRRVVVDLIEMGRWHAGDRDILIVFDAGYDAPRMAHLLDGLPVEVLGRMRSDRVMRRPTPSPSLSPTEYALSYPQGGRPPKHGKEFRFAKPETWGEPDAATVQVTDRYGTARAMAWDRIHPRLTTRSAWIDHTGELPIVEGALIRLQVDRLPGGGDPPPLWLWSPATGLSREDVDVPGLSMSVPPAEVRALLGEPPRIPVRSQCSARGDPAGQPIVDGQERMNSMMRSRTATRLPLDRPARSLARRGRALGVALALGALLASGATMTLAAPAVAATGDVKCPSTDCVRIAPAAGSPVAVAPDKAGTAVYLAYSGGDLLKLDLATGALSTVTTGLGNLRGVAVDGGSAYITNFNGVLQQVDLATGSRRTLASGLPSLFGVARFGTTTYVTDGNGEIVAVPDGGTARVVATGLGFSYGLAFDKAGLAYTADMGQGRILQTNVATGTTRVLASETYEPTSISVGGDGLVYFMVANEVKRVNPATGVQSHVTNLVGINSFSFWLAASGDAYTTGSGGDGLWRITGLTSR